MAIGGDGGAYLGICGDTGDHDGGITLVRWQSAGPSLFQFDSQVALKPPVQACLISTKYYISQQYKNQSRLVAGTTCYAARPSPLYDIPSLSSFMRRAYSSINLVLYQPLTRNQLQGFNIPKEVSNHIFSSPEALAPFSTCDRNFTREVLMRSCPARVPAEKHQSVVEVRQVELDRHVVYPRCDSIYIPGSGLVDC
jgi:hypothetical protein